MMLSKQLLSIGFTHQHPLNFQFRRAWKFLFILICSGLLLLNIPSSLYAAQGDTTRISTDLSGTDANGESINAGISEDGRYISFESVASDLVANDNNGLSDIFVHDKQTGQTTRVSVDSSGTESNGFSQNANISDNGRYVTFSSLADNLVANDNNSVADIFVHDRTTGQTTRVSVDSAGTEATNTSSMPAISATGRYIVFASTANDLVANDTNFRQDIFVHDRDTGDTTRVSVNSSGEAGNHNSINPAISSNGRYVAFSSQASNLVLNDSNGTNDIFVHDRDTGETTRISVNSSGAEGNNFSDQPSISANGRYVAFQSHASNLVSGDSNGTTDIFVHDRDTQQTTVVSVDSSGTQASFLSMSPDISDNGRYVAFHSIDPNLASNDLNSALDIFVHDMQTGQTSLASRRSSGISGNASSSNPAISADGTFVAFESEAGLLVHDDFNGLTDVFINEYIGSAPPPPPSGADMRVTLSDSRDPIDTESNLSLTATASNAGPADATNVMLSVDLPDDVTYVSSHASCSESGTIVSCTLGNIASGDSSQISILVTTPFTAGTLTTTASVMADQTDPASPNNSDTETTLVVLPDVSISDSTAPTDDLTVLFGTLRIGDTTDEIITISNNSISTPVSISVTSTSLAAPFQVLDPNSCHGSLLDAGSDCVLTVEYNPTQAGDQTDTLVLEIGIDNVNIVLRGTAVEDAADLAIEKEANILEVSVGVSGSDLTTYTLTVTNNGPDAIDAVVTDQLPAEMQIRDGMSATASLGSYDASTGEWNVGNLDIDQQETLQIPVQVTSGIGCITNTATVAAAPGETVTEMVSGNNSDEVVIVTQDGCADLSIRGRASDAIFIGAPITSNCMHVYFDVGVTNNGPSTAEGVVIRQNNRTTASILENVQYNDGSIGGGYGRGYMDCNEHGKRLEEETEVSVGTLAPGETRWVRVVPMELFPVHGDDVEVTIDYRVELTTHDPDTANNTTVFSATVIRTGSDPGGESGSGGCFIATAAYGSPMAAEIELLRQFRDEILLSNAVGSRLVDAYYATSPPLAAFIAEHDSLRAITRGLLAPVIWWTGLVMESPTLGWTVLLLTVCTPVLIAAHLRRRIRNRNSLTLHS